MSHSIEVNDALESMEGVFGLLAGTEDLTAHRFPRITDLEINRSDRNRLPRTDESHPWTTNFNLGSESEQLGWNSAPGWGYPPVGPSQPLTLPRDRFHSTIKSTIDSHSIEVRTEVWKSMVSRE